MNNNPAWQAFTGLVPLLVVFGLLGLLAWWLARPKGGPAPTQAPAPVLPPMPAHYPALRKALALLYGGGATIGLYLLLPIRPLGEALPMLLWGLLVLQLLLAMLGCWPLWQGRAWGVRLMYWLSWSNVPVWITPMASYYCGIGLGLMLMTSFGPGQASFDFRLHAGYIGHLGLMGNGPVWLLGANVIALGLALWLARYMRAAGIGLRGLRG